MRTRISIRVAVVAALRLVLAAIVLGAACVAWAGSATHFSVAIAATQTAGTPVTVTVTALDAANATDTAYAGTVHFTTSATGATLPADSTLTNGVGVFSATFTQAGGPSTVTATDTVTALITGTSASFTVFPGPLASFLVSPIGVATANVPIFVSVYAFDAFGNLLVLSTPTVHVTSSDPFATLPGDFSFFVLGSFTVTLRSPGAQTITVTDTADPSVTGSSGVILVISAVVTHFTVSAPANATAGTPFPFTVTADDSGGNAVISYAGTVHFTSSDGLAVLPGDVTLINGVGTFSAVLRSAGSSSITATDTGNASITGSSAPITVAPGPATHFAVGAPASTTADAGLGVTVTALDAIGNVATGYAGAVHFTSTDAVALLPLDQALLNGVGTFAATLRTAGVQSIIATDTVSPSVAGTSNPITVVPGPVTHFVMSAPPTATTGTPFNITVTAKDASNNTVTAYAGTAHFTASDAQAVLPADSILTNGVGTFSTTLKTAGVQTVTATDTVTSITGSAAITAFLPATHFSVSAPAAAAAGSAFTFTVTALDASNGVVANYGGTVHFTSSDGTATLPPDATLTAGVGTFTATLRTAGTQSIVATDTVSPSIAGTSNPIAVAPGAVLHFAMSAPATATTGTPFNITVTAKGASNNTVTTYAGTVHFTASDLQAVLPADSMLTNGVGTFAATLKTPGAQTVTATDTVTPSITGAATIAVSMPATHFSVSAPAVAAAGSAFTFTVSALDASNGVVANYAGTVHFTSSDGTAILPADATLAAGIGTFPATLGTIGSQTLSATDATTASITGASTPIAVVMTRFSGPSATGSGIVTASFTGGGATCTFAAPRLIPLVGAPGSPPAGTAPGGLAFPHGLFDFRTTGCTPGSMLAFTITYPAALPAGTQYWKYGPRTGFPAGWYVLPATITGNTVTFSITDGALGDDDLAANGGLVDQGGPGVPMLPGPIDAVPTLSRSALALLALLLAGLPMLWMRKSRAPRGPG